MRAAIIISLCVCLLLLPGIARAEAGPPERAISVAAEVLREMEARALTDDRWPGAESGEINMSLGTAIPLRGLDPEAVRAQAGFAQSLGEAEKWLFIFLLDNDPAAYLIVGENEGACEMVEYTSYGPEQAGEIVARYAAVRQELTDLGWPASLGLLEVWPAYYFLAEKDGRFFVTPLRTYGEGADSGEPGWYSGEALLAALPERVEDQAAGLSLAQVAAQSEDEPGLARLLWIAALAGLGAAAFLLIRRAGGKRNAGSVD